ARREAMFGFPHPLDPLEDTAKSEDTARDKHHCCLFLPLRPPDSVPPPPGYIHARGLLPVRQPSPHVVRAARDHHALASVEPPGLSSPPLFAAVVLDGPEV